MVFPRQCSRLHRIQLRPSNIRNRALLPLPLPSSIPVFDHASASVSVMNQRSRSSSAKPLPPATNERLHRYLRPGALARLRDARISTARSASLALLDLSLPSYPSPRATPPAQIEGLRPFFAARVRGPQFPRRKKLSAAKSVYLAPSSPDLADPFLDSFGVDLVAAH